MSQASHFDRELRFEDRWSLSTAALRALEDTWVDGCEVDLGSLSLVVRPARFVRLHPDGGSLWRRRLRLLFGG